LLCVLSTSQQWSNHQHPGESADGVRLSIALSNNIINVGVVKITATIQNSSTNEIQLDEYMAMSDFDVYLANSSGKAERLSPPKPLSGSRVPIILKPEDSRSWLIPVTIGSEFKSGDYVIKASRSYRENGIWLVMQSNFLNVSIK
jgi:hypothetical protein